jgi:hypothetical protein
VIERQLLPYVQQLLDDEKAQDAPRRACVGR